METWVYGNYLLKKRIQLLYNNKHLIVKRLTFQYRPRCTVRTFNPSYAAVSVRRTVVKAFKVTRN
jgi:hypothetical protein